MLTVECCHAMRLSGSTHAHSSDLPSPSVVCVGRTASHRICTDIPPDHAICGANRLHQDLVRHRRLYIRDIVDPTGDTGDHEPELSLDLFVTPCIEIGYNDL